MTPLEGIQAIKALLQGEFDNKILLSMGSLSTNTDEDILRIVERVLGVNDMEVLTKVLKTQLKHNKAFSGGMMTATDGCFTLMAVTDGFETKYTLTDENSIVVEQWKE